MTKTYKQFLENITGEIPLRTKIMMSVEEWFSKKGWNKRGKNSWSTEDDLRTMKRNDAKAMLMSKGFTVANQARVFGQIEMESKIGIKATINTIEHDNGNGNKINITGVKFLFKGTDF